MSCRTSVIITWITLMSLTLVVAAQAADMRIVNGYITDISQTPYLVQLRSPIDGGAFCGGTLVTPLHVVTAAHCLGVYKNEDIKMVAGTAMKFGNAGVERRIVSAHIHPEYSRETMHADVAVLKLNQPMVGRNIKTVPLCARALKPNEYFLISGFGRTANDEPGSKVLRSVSVPTMSFEECSYRYVDRITDVMMCAHTNGRDACEGDSGGPGVFNGQLCAIVSWGAKCGDDYFPGVYTNVYAVRGFIERAIRN